MYSPIVLDDYVKAVEHCLGLAQGDSSGSRVMAQVLLSAYNGHHFQMDVAEMSVLDRENYKAVLNVIRGRYELGLEPHNAVEDGPVRFRDLWSQWECLEITERAKKRCPYCDGGRVYSDTDDEEGCVCENCGGSGRVCGVCR